MKKTVTINISGIIFHIDEDAYDRLNRYMSRLKRHFSRMEGRDEIITDIESRIAELLQEKVVDNKQVITINDIEEVVKLMGEPSEMDQDSDYEPAKETEPRPGYRRAKRLFRDPDTRMVAGVSSGLSAYFNVDPVWIRLLFVISLFAGGFGVLVYLILWIVLPQAITTADKLEMRGEPVNISNIERSVRDEFGNVKEKFNEFADDAKETFKKKSPGSPTLFDNLAEVIGGIFRIVLKVIIVLIGLVLIIFGLGFIIAFVVGTAGLSSFSVFEHGEMFAFSISTVLDMVFPGRVIGILAVVSLILLFAIPLIMISYLGIRLIVGNSVKVPYIGITAFGFWLAGLVMAVFVGLTTGMDFRHSAFVATDYEVNIKPEKVLYIKAQTDPMLFNGYNRSKTNLFDGEWNVKFKGDDYILYNVPEFYASSKTRDGKVTLEVSNFAKGSSQNEAYRRAEDLTYPVTTNDSTIILSTYYQYPPNAKIRNQRVSLKLRLPIGQIVRFDENMEEFFDENPNYQYRREGFDGNIWIMTESGLKPFIQESESSINQLLDTEDHSNERTFALPMCMVPIRIIGF